jgi:hypothetical protein
MCGALPTRRRGDLSAVGSSSSSAAVRALRFAQDAPLICAGERREDEMPPAARLRMHLGCGAPLAQRMEGA